MPWSKKHSTIYEKVIKVTDELFRLHPEVPDYSELIRKCVNDYLQWWDEDEVEEQTGVKIN